MIRNAQSLAVSKGIKDKMKADPEFAAAKTKIGKAAGAHTRALMKNPATRDAQRLKVSRGLKRYYKNNTTAYRKKISLGLKAALSHPVKGAT